MTESGFYAWLTRPPSERAIRHAWLTDLVTEIHDASRQTYGSIRVHAELNLGRGVIVGLYQVGTSHAPCRSQRPHGKTHP